MSARRALAGAVRRVTPRHLIAVAVLLLAAIVVAMLLSNSPAPADTIEDELEAAIRIDPVQPPPELIERIEVRPLPGDEGVRRLSDFSEEEYPSRSETVLMNDHLPLYPYSSLHDGPQNVLHPMGLGRFLVRNAEGSLAKETVDAALSVAHELPNGGLAWYYPRHYLVSRMLGEKLKYSSISQGTIIAGLSKTAEAGAISMSLAEKAFKALQWPFEKGGVNLGDRALLEMPSFSGPPEIILNGWVDALLHIEDYAETTGDEDATKLFESNVSFLAEVLPEFDSRDAGLSRYSDVSPYRIKVRLGSPDDLETLRILYRPVKEGFPSIKVDLDLVEDPDRFSVYKNQILRRNGREAFVWISCSQFYQTVLVSDSSEMSVEMSTGRLQPPARQEKTSASTAGRPAGIGS